MFSQPHDEDAPHEAPEAAALQVAGLLRAGRVPHESHFDRFLPADLRAVSSTYWTPLEVVVRAASWLDEVGVSQVVDIGSGVGKFCVVGALAGRCTYVGLEQRPRLVAAASELARQFGVQDRVRFVAGVFGEAPTPVADAYYFFNSFGENLFLPEDWLDHDTELGDGRFARDLQCARVFLRSLPSGAYVLTYNGFGGRLPRSYAEVRVDRELPNPLRLSRKR
jgi:hypothetical protein